MPSERIPDILDGTVRVFLKTYLLILGSPVYLPLHWSACRIAGDHLVRRGWKTWRSLFRYRYLGLGPICARTGNTVRSKGAPRQDSYIYRYLRGIRGLPISVPSLHRACARNSHRPSSASDRETMITEMPAKPSAAPPPIARAAHMRLLVDQLHKLEERLRAGGGPSKIEK